MKPKFIFLAMIVALLPNIPGYGQWKTDTHGDFRIHFKSLDDEEKSEYVQYVKTGVEMWRHFSVTDLE